MTTKEAFDVRTMRYFAHPRSMHTRITKQDRDAMARLSSRGIQPQTITKGLACLMWGKTYRDEQITAYRRDIRLGLFTKYEIVMGFPTDMRDWIVNKLADVPYDSAGESSNMFISMYHNELTEANHAQRTETEA